jgi:sugar/nucleoside kinase (ribokinase family)
MGGEAAAEILARARSQGIVTSADILAPGDPGVLEWIESALAEIDYLLPNDEQVVGLTGEDDLERACRALLARGVGCVVATRGGEGALVVDRNGAEAIPAFGVEVVDTTGCGDAFSAGFLRGLALGRQRPAAATLGCAAAGLVAGGLGSDYGDFDLEAADSLEP